jgi:hypothetical protein
MELYPSYPATSGYRRMPASETSLARTAAASVAAVAAGLLLAYYMSPIGGTSEDLAQLGSAVLIGLILGGASAKVSIRSAVVQGLLPSALLAATYVGVSLVRVLLRLAMHPDTCETCLFKSWSVDATAAHLGVGMLMFLAAWLVVSLTSIIAQRQILMLLAHALVRRLTRG